MPSFVHRRNTPDGPRYRYWSTVTDSYHSAPMDRDAFVAFLRRDGRSDDILARMARADARGTSAMFGPDEDMDGPWQTEICPCCAHFHHAFVLREGDGMCSWCGESANDYGHAPPCAGEAS